MFGEIIPEGTGILRLHHCVWAGFLRDEHHQMFKELYSSTSVTKNAYTKIDIT